MKIRIGTCGFPAEKEKLFSELDVIEIQQTFYHPPQIETLKKWKESAGQRVEFTLKAWQLITHPSSSPTYKRIKGDLKQNLPKISDKIGFFKNTKEVFKAYDKTLECCEAVGGRVILFQTPASFRETEENINNIKNFFEKAFRPQGIFFVWEPRGRWSTKILRELSKECKVFVGGDPFGGGYLIGEFLYLRLHGIEGFRYRFKEEDFRKIREIIGNKKGYVMFNNISMFEDALKFKKFLKGEKNG